VLTKLFGLLCQNKNIFWSLDKIIPFFFVNGQNCPGHIWCTMMVCHMGWPIYHHSNIFDARTGKVMRDFKGSANDFAIGGTGGVAEVPWPIFKYKSFLRA